MVHDVPPEGDDVEDGPREVGLAEEATPMQMEEEGEDGPLDPLAAASPGARVGTYTSSGTFITSEGFVNRPVRTLVGDLMGDVAEIHVEVAALREEVAALQNDLDTVGKLVAGIHEILVRQGQKP